MIIEQVKAFLQLSSDFLVSQSIELDCFWQELLKVPQLLTKRIVLINKFRSASEEQKPHFKIDKGIGILVETKRIMEIHYFFMIDSNENRNMFDQYITEFMNTNQSQIIGIDELSLEKMVVNLLHQKRLLISCAESCTGGMIISRIIGVPGASLVTQESYVTYSDKAKIKLLGIKPSLLETYGTVSSEVASKMATKVKQISRVDVGIGVTGYARSDIETPDDGLFYYAINYLDQLIVDKDCVFGTRDEMRFDQATIILWRLLGLLKQD